MPIRQPSTPFRIAVVWKEAPESKTQESRGLSTERIRASYTSSVITFVELFPVFFLGSLQFFLKWPVLPQIQHSGWLPHPDSLLPFLDLDLSHPEFLPYPLPLVSRFKATPKHEASLESLLRISALGIKSLISLYLSLLFPAKLLTAILMAPQMFGKYAKTINAWISSLKSIFMKDN
jgi:hypothetical protein